MPPGAWPDLKCDACILLHAAESAALSLKITFPVVSHGVKPVESNLAAFTLLHAVQDARGPACAMTTHGVVKVYSSACAARCDRAQVIPCRPAADPAEKCSNTKQVGLGLFFIVGKCAL